MPLTAPALAQSGDETTTTREGQTASADATSVATWNEAEAMNCFKNNKWDCARRQFRNGCENDVEKACIFLAQLYANGLGVKKEAKRAQDLLKKGCDGGFEPACFALALNLRAGSRGDKNPERAVQRAAGTSLAAS